MKYDPHHFDMPFRPNYELRSVYAWGAGAATNSLMMAASDMPVAPFLVMSGLCLAMAASRAPVAYRLRHVHKSLFGTPLEFMSLKEVKKIVSKHKDMVWLGNGYTWENKHAQRCYELIKRDLEADLGKKYANAARDVAGAPWIHGLEAKRGPIYIPSKHLEGHLLITGTTGSGKTRLLDMMTTPDILRNEHATVIIIDPKGDKELRDNARRACESQGRPDRFIMLHPAFPEDSVRINPLQNFTRPSELASRITSLLPNRDAFSEFSWNAINTVVQAMVMAKELPNLKLIRRYLESGVEGLLNRIIVSYVEESLSPEDAKSWLEMYYPDTGKDTPRMIAKMRSTLYRDLLEKNLIKAHEDIGGLMTMFEHDAAHFSKMIATLLPLLSQLTSGEVGDLLSPDPADLDDRRTITDSYKITEQGKVFYVGLDSLTDLTVASAIGAMLLSDLTAVAGDRYNFENISKKHKIYLYVDEAAECLSSQLLMLLNKGRGALITARLATQTIPDFVARTGDEAVAYQFLGNLNNMISLRVIDSKTQEYVSEGLVKTRIKSISHAQGSSTDGKESTLHSGSVGERMMEEEVAPFPAELLGSLPNLEFIAKVSGGRVIKGKIPILQGADAQ